MYRRHLTPSIAGGGLGVSHLRKAHGSEPLPLGLRHCGGLVPGGTRRRRHSPSGSAQGTLWLAPLGVERVEPCEALIAVQRASNVGMGTSVLEPQRCSSRIRNRPALG